MTSLLETPNEDVDAEAEYPDSDSESLTCHSEWPDDEIYPVPKVDLNLPFQPQIRNRDLLLSPHLEEMDYSFSFEGELMSRGDETIEVQYAEEGVGENVKATRLPGVEYGAVRAPAISGRAVSAQDERSAGGSQVLERTPISAKDLESEGSPSPNRRRLFQDTQNGARENDDSTLPQDQLSERAFFVSRSPISVQDIQSRGAPSLGQPVSVQDWGSEGAPSIDGAAVFAPENHDFQDNQSIGTGVPRSAQDSESVNGVSVYFHATAGSSTNAPISAQDLESNSGNRELIQNSDYTGNEVPIAPMEFLVSYSEPAMQVTDSARSPNPKRARKAIDNPYRNAKFELWSFRDWTIHDDTTRMTANNDVIYIAAIEKDALYLKIAEENAETKKFQISENVSYDALGISISDQKVFIYNNHIIYILDLNGTRLNEWRVGYTILDLVGFGKTLYALKEHGEIGLLQFQDRNETETEMEMRKDNERSTPAKTETRTTKICQLVNETARKPLQNDPRTLTAYPMGSRRFAINQTGELLAVSSVDFGRLCVHIMSTETSKFVQTIRIDPGINPRMGPPVAFISTDKILVCSRNKVYMATLDSGHDTPDSVETKLDSSPHIVETDFSFVFDSATSNESVLMVDQKSIISINFYDIMNTKNNDKVPARILMNVEAEYTKPTIISVCNSSLMSDGYLLAENGTIFVLRLHSTSRLLKRMRFKALGDLKHCHVVMRLTDNESFIFGIDRKLLILSSSGEHVWEKILEKEIQGIQFHDGRIFVLLNDKVLVFSPFGKLVETIELGGLECTSFSIGNSSIVISTRDSNIYEYDLKSRTLDLYLDLNLTSDPKILTDSENRVLVIENIQAKTTENGHNILQSHVGILTETTENPNCEASAEISNDENAEKASQKVISVFNKRTLLSRISMESLGIGIGNLSDLLLVEHRALIACRDGECFVAWTFDEDVLINHW